MDCIKPDYRDGINIVGNLAIGGKDSARSAKNKLPTFWKTPKSGTRVFLSDNACAKGAQSSPTDWKFVRAADIFLFPFQDQPLNTGRRPNKICDYMAAGRPTVSNRTGDIVDLFETHQIGLLASDNAEDMAHKVFRLINDEGLATKFGNNARKTAEQYYDWRLLAQKLERCLLQVTTK